MAIVEASLAVAATATERLKTDVFTALGTFPFLRDDDVKALYTEYVGYLKLARASPPAPTAIALKDWWTLHAAQLPCWSTLAKTVFVLQSNSAASERVFAAVRRAFDEQQRSSLSDYLTATVMLGYNHRDQKPKKTGVPDSMFDNVVEHD